MIQKVCCFLLNKNKTIVCNYNYAKLKILINPIRTKYVEMKP